MRLLTSAYAAVAIGVLASIHALIAGASGARDSNTAQTKPVAYGNRPFMSEHVVWSPSEGGVWQRFVYGLAVTKKGTVLAFCEGRITPGDHTPHHLLLKRSVDFGRSWSDDIFFKNGSAP